MADNIAVTPGTGATVAADDVGGVLYQRVKLAAGADGSATDVSTAAPLPVSDAGGSLTVDGTVAVSGTVAVTDNSGSLTVDGTVAATQSGSWSVISTADSVSTATVPTQVSGTVTSTVLLASNASRKGAVIVNDSTAVLYVKLGATAASTSYTYKLAAGDTLELPSRPIYTGVIHGVWASATGAAAITEL